MDTVKWLLILYDIVNFILGMTVAHRFGIVDKNEERKTAIIVSQTLTCGLILGGIINSYKTLMSLCFLCLDTLAVALAAIACVKKNTKQ